MMFYAAYFGHIFTDAEMHHNLLSMTSNRCIFGRTKDEVIAADRRNLIVPHHGVFIAVGISDYPEYCGTTPSPGWWIATFEAVRVS